MCAPLWQRGRVSEHSCAMTHMECTGREALWRDRGDWCVEGRQRCHAIIQQSMHRSRAGCADVVSWLNGSVSDDTDDGDPRHSQCRTESYAVSRDGTSARHEGGKAPARRAIKGGAMPPLLAGLCPPLAGLPLPPPIPAVTPLTSPACRDLSPTALFTATTSHSEHHPRFGSHLAPWEAHTARVEGHFNNLPVVEWRGWRAR